VNRELANIPWWNAVKDNSAIVLERYPVEQLLQAARRMMPRARRISVVSSLNATSGFILPGVVRDVESANQRLGGEPFVIADTFGPRNGRTGNPIWARSDTRPMWFESYNSL
jgi:hypothetical protein